MLRLRLGYVVIGAALVVCVVSAWMLDQKRLVGLWITFAVAVLLLFGDVMLVALAGTPDERKKRQAQADRWGAAIGVAPGRASGGWTPRQDDRETPQYRNGAD